MATTTDYINQLKTDKQTLANNLVAKGIEATNDETFTSLVPKVLDIQTGITPSGSIDITENGTYDVTDKESAIVNVPTKTLGTKTITANGTYKASDDNLDGYSEVEVDTGKYAPRAKISFENYTGTELDYELANLDTSNITLMNSMFSNCKNLTSLDVSNFDTSKVTRLDYMFNYCEKLTSLDVSNFDTSNCTAMYDMFERCSNLKTLDLSNYDTSKVDRMNQMFYFCSSLISLNLSNFNTSNVTTMASMFSNCANLETMKINSFDTSKVTNLSSTFNNCMKLDTIPQLNGNNINNLSSSFFNCNNLTNFNGITNLGQAYSTSQSANYSYYKLILSSCTKLTEQSLINILNNLYDIATKGCNTQSVVLGSTNLAKLTSDEGQLALDNAATKGWAVS